MRISRITGLLAWLLFLLAVLLGLPALGQSSLMIGSLSSVNGTSNSTAVATSVIYFPRGTFTVQNGGTTTTNALKVMAQISLDGTNFVTVATYWPTTNAAGTETFTCGLGCVTNWLRVQVVTTNAVSVGVTYQQ